MQTAGAAKGNRDFRYRRYAGSSAARQSSCDRDSAEQTMLRMIPRQDHLKDRVGPPRQAGEGCQDAWTVILVQAVKFADWTFRYLCAGVERTFEHVLAMRGYQQIGSKTADNVEGLAKQSTRNLQFVVAQAQVQTSCDKDCRVIADTDGNIQFLTAFMGRPCQHSKMVIGRNTDER